MRRLLRRLGERCAIEKRVHPHGLRHTHAAELAAENMPPNLIQAQLGHGSLATTRPVPAPHRSAAAHRRYVSACTGGE
ncbi:MAG: tyrosine-type recombinase/integrase [Solirubrobacteraceae bacterium]